MPASACTERSRTVPPCSAVPPLLRVAVRHTRPSASMRGGRSPAEAQ